MKLQMKETPNFYTEFRVKEVFCNMETKKKPKPKTNL
jgi:hypothetical protein